MFSLDQKKKKKEEACMGLSKFGPELNVSGANQSFTKTDLAAAKADVNHRKLQLPRLVPSFFLHFLSSQTDYLKCSIFFYHFLWAFQLVCVSDPKNPFSLSVC